MRLQIAITAVCSLEIYQIALNASVKDRKILKISVPPANVTRDFGMDIDIVWSSLHWQGKVKLNIGEQNMLPARKFNGLSSLPDFFTDFFDGGVIDRVSAKAPAINVIEDDGSLTLS